MLTLNELDNYIDNLQSIDNSSLDYRSKFLEFYNQFNQIIINFISSEKRYFSGSYQGLLYIFNQFKLSEEHQKSILKFRRFARQLLSDRKIYSKKEDSDNALIACLILLKYIFNNKIQSDWAEDKIHLTPLKDYSNLRKLNIESTSRIKIIVNNISEKNSKKKIFGLDENGETIALFLNDYWNDIYAIVWHLAELNIINASYFNEIKGIKCYNCTSDTLLILEPNYLTDVMDIAYCFSNEPPNELCSLVKRFKLTRPGINLLKGNLVNYIFDELMIGNEVDVESLLIDRLKNMPLDYIYLINNEDLDFNKIVSECEYFKSNILKFIEDLKFGDLFIEPSFLSPTYGIQGRLDALLIDEDNPNSKEVIELKSGKFPDKDLRVYINQDNFYFTNSWKEHSAQVSCYNLIVSEVYPERIGNSSIFYAKDEKKPLRNAPINKFNYMALMQQRNRLIRRYKDLADSKYEFFDSIKLSQKDLSSSFTRRDFYEISSQYESLSPELKIYFNNMLSFIQREIFTIKTGDYTSLQKNYISSLWQKSLIEKRNDRNVILGLQPDLEKSDINSSYFTFIRDDNTNSNIRVNDFVVLYPTLDTEESGLLKGQILKAVVKEINSSYIILSLMNKLFKYQELLLFQSWNIELDNTDSLAKRLMPLVFEGINSNSLEKKLGFEKFDKPDDFYNINKSYLTENQINTINKALNSKDVFLIQGPPGTGKTSYVLKEIVSEFHNENPESDILIAAYTNRAVDEICTILKLGGIDFLRLGTKSSSPFSENILINLALESESLDSFYLKFQNIRIVISTISSLISNSTIFDVKNFKLAVVDEAAQVLESDIFPILSNSEKVILIGDEKQLPAIVSQKKNYCSVDDEVLNSIEMHSLANSYFERMLKLMQIKSYDNYSMLTKQARMHPNIMDYANLLSYNNKLEYIDLNKHCIELKSFFDEESKELINSKRVILIESQKESISFNNDFEATTILKILEEFSLTFDINSPDSIGVISPFRAQCSNIKSKLGDKYKDLVVDTVERFQGSEREVIILSLAINRKEDIEYIKSEIADISSAIIDRKLNVAMTRAKNFLIILANSDLFEEEGPYKKLFDEIKRNKAVLKL